MGSLLTGKPLPAYLITRRRRRGWRSMLLQATMLENQLVQPMPRPDPCRRLDPGGDRDRASCSYAAISKRPIPDVGTPPAQKCRIGTFLPKIRMNTRYHLRYLLHKVPLDLSGHHWCYIELHVACRMCVRGTCQAETPPKKPLHLRGLQWSTPTNRIKLVGDVAASTETAINIDSE